jgi:hypothetical protein
MKHEPWAWFHSQNLSEDLPPGRRRGGKLRHGRCWLHWHLDAKKLRQLVFNAEWLLLSGRFCCRLDLGGGDSDDDIQLSLGCGLFTVYLSVEGLYCLGINVPGADIGVDVHNGCVWLNLWSRRNEWRSRDPWWRKTLCLHVVDWLLGEPRYQEELIIEQPCLIPMPEGSYQGTAKLYKSTWTRARWSSTILQRCTIDITNGGIPVPGKGENSWDCGDDAIHGLTCTATSIEDGVNKLVADAKETRERYGGSRWTPSPQLSN